MDQRPFTLRDFEREFQIAVLIIFSAIGILAISKLCASISQESKGPEWVGAIGTVAALFAAIWLANSETRRLRKEANDRAFVSVAKILGLVDAARTSLRNQLDGIVLEQDLKKDVPYGLRAELVADCIRWEERDIESLIVLPNHVAAVLAQVMSSVEQCVGLMKTLDKVGSASFMQDELPKNEETIRTCLRNSIWRLGAVHDTMTEFLYSHLKEERPPPDDQE